MDKFVAVDPAIPGAESVVAFDIESNALTNFWQYPQTEEGVAAMEAHSRRISAAIGIHVDLLGVQGEERSFYELANERNKVAGLAFQQQLKELMKKWMQDSLRMIFTKKRGPRRAVRTASARKRKHQRQATRVLVMTWRDYTKMINFISTGRITSSEPVQWELRKPKSDNPNEFDLVRTHQGKPIDE